MAVLALIVLALEVRRRLRKASGRLGRQRGAGPIRSGVGGLNLDRQSLRGGGRKKPNRLSPIAGPVVVGLVFIFMGAWLAFSYFMPDAETTAAVLPPSKTAPPAAPATTRALGGRITIGGPPETAPASSAASSGAAAVLGTDNSRPSAPTFVTDAARSMIGSYSRMDQVGLLPSQAKTQPAAQPKAAQPKAAQPKGAQPKAAQQTAAASKPARPAETPAPETEAPKQPAVAASSLVGAASGAATGASKPAALADGRDEALLSGGRDFTVHLSSFRDRDNAENYRSKLVEAGEQAYITETTVNGQHWYRVMSGRFKSRADAANYGRDLKRRDLTADTGQYMVKPVD